MTGRREEEAGRGFQTMKEEQGRVSETMAKCKDILPNMHF